MAWFAFSPSDSKYLQESNKQHVIPTFILRPILAQKPFYETGLFSLHITRKIEKEKSLQ